MLKARFQSFGRWIACHPVYVFVIVCISVGRVYIGSIVPLRANASAKNTLDDYLMIQYAQLFEHFHSAEQNITTWALAKSMSFSYLLNVLSKMGIPYSFFVSCMWIIAALLTVSAIRRIWKRLIGSEMFQPSLVFFAAVYAFLVFCPTAFDKDTGTRIYRESLTAPTTLLIIGLCLILVLSAIDAGRNESRISVREICWGIILGCVWTFFWFLKESGIWLAPLLVVSLIVAACMHWNPQKRVNAGSNRQRGGVLHIGRRLISTAIVVAVPLAVFAVGDTAYRGVNMHFFGVPYASVRTEGAIAGFFERLYAIDSEDKTEEHWIPWSVIEQAVDASPTLRAQTALLEELKHSPYVDDEDGVWDEGPHHDMGVWALIQAMEAVDMYPNQTDPQRLFEQINTELDQADLPKVEGFSFSGSLVPKTIGDIWAVRGERRESVHSPERWPRYVVSDDDFENLREDQNQRVRLIELTLNEVMDRYDDQPTSRRLSRTIGLTAARIIVRIYQYVAPIAVCLAWCGIVIACAMLIRRRRQGPTRASAMVLITTVAGAGSAFALVLAASWLCSTRMETMVYYTAAAVPLVQTIEIVGSLLCYTVATLWLKNHSSQESARTL